MENPHILLLKSYEKNSTHSVEFHIKYKNHFVDIYGNIIAFMHEYAFNKYCEYYGRITDMTYNDFFHFFLV